MKRMSILEQLRQVLGKKQRISYSVQQLLYRLSLEQDLRHFENRDKSPIPSVSVTDLVSCSMRYHLVRMYPELKFQMNYHPTLILGRLLHVGLDAVLREYWRDAEFEKPIEKIISLDDGRVVRIAGIVDAYLPDESLVVEFKTSRADHDLPLQHHVLQLQIYMNILEAEKGLLFYINPDRIAEYSIDKALDDWELQQLVNETLGNTKHPRWGEWECSYCIFNIMCPFKKQNNKWRR